MVEPSDIDALARVQAGIPARWVQKPTPPADTRLEVFFSNSRKDLAQAKTLRDTLITRDFGAHPGLPLIAIPGIKLEPGRL